ncbi:myb-related transcription factor, partner of profilin-like [Ambystoma mexicanum]|uniref:myb-related transcription factor, partner of profilin-like n=1 Tax=Ambystoma mexicanum TaxID=8296 RepID=UPI0037E9BA2C
MPKAVKKGASRQRKERFDEEELTMLAETLAENANVVFAQSLKREAVIKKKGIWALVAQRVSAVGNTSRTTKDVRKRWDDLHLRVRNILSANRSQAIATGRGASSPIKLSRWEEICASTIGIEAIEGLGSDPDSEARYSTPQMTRPRKRAWDEGNRPSSSKAPHKLWQAPKSKPPQGATALVPPRPVNIVPTTTVTLAQETVEGALSAENSSVGEAAAIAPLTDDEARAQVCVPVEDNSSDLPGTPSPAPSPQRSSVDSDRGTTPEQSGGEYIQGSMSPIEDPIEIEHDTQAPSTSTGVPAGVQQAGHSSQRQEELTALVIQFVTDNAQARQEWRENTASLGKIIAESTSRLCEVVSALRQVLSCIADAMEAERPAPQMEQAGTPSSSSSTQTSPLRRSVRTLYRPDMPPPGAGSGRM